MVSRCNNRLHEGSSQLARSLDVHRAVEPKDPAVGRGRICGQSALIRFAQPGTDTNATGIRMFDDDADRLIESFSQGEGCVEVQEIIEREFLPLQQLGPRHGRLTHEGVAIQGSLLVRILAVTELLHSDQAEIESTREYGFICLRSEEHTSELQ